MQRKMMAIAVIGALGIPATAWAQASSVQMYGRIYYEYGYADQGTGTNGPRVNVDIMQAPGSNIGFKGEEKLGGGMSAWFQCESTADVRGVSQEGFCGRNSAIGLKGSLGNVFMGRWDTPFKRTILDGAGLGTSRITGLWGSSFLLTGGSTSTLDGSARATWIRRQANTVNYHSPIFNGFQVMAAVSSANGATSATTAAVAAKPRVWSVGANYKTGPLNLAGAYERHVQFGAAGGANDDSAWHLSAVYALRPNVKIGGVYTEQTLETSSTTESKINAWHLGVDWRISGPHSLLAAYTAAGDVKGNSTVTVAGSGATRPAALNLVGGALASGNTGASLWSVHYRHTFSKRTTALLGYGRLKNDSQAQYTLGGLSGSARGNAQNAYGVVVDHRF